MKFINKGCYTHSQKFFMIPPDKYTHHPGAHSPILLQEPIPTHPSPPGFFPGTGGVPPRTLDVFPFEQQLSKLQLAAKPRGPLTLSRTTAWPLCAWVPWLVGELVLESNHHSFGGTTLRSLSNEAGFMNPALTSLVFISFIQF